VAVGPDRVQTIRTNQRDVRELVLTGAEERLGAEAAAIPRLALAGCTRAGSAEHIEGDVMCGAVRPLDEQRSMLLVVVEAHRPKIDGHRR
jgi:hypothetical protein